VRDHYLMIVGGPRISHTFAKELGYDAGFGPGSTASTVASFIAQELVARKKEIIFSPGDQESV
jgi:beta-lysine 5,6-aminomutase beta subunit